MYTIESLIKINAIYHETHRFQQAEVDITNKFVDIIEKSRSSTLDTVLINIFYMNIIPELLDKPVVMSDDTIGIFREFDYKNPKYPKIEIDGQILKSNEDWYCESMYIDD